MDEEFYSQKDKEDGCKSSIMQSIGSDNELP